MIGLAYLKFFICYFRVWCGVDIGFMVIFFSLLIFDEIVSEYTICVLFFICIAGFMTSISLFPLSLMNGVKSNRDKDKDF